MEKDSENEKRKMTDRLFHRHSTTYLQALVIFSREKSSEADRISTLSCIMMQTWCQEKLSGSLCIMFKGIKAKSMAPREYLHSSS
ncbi:hypothetical protein EUGRSUZ_E03539 [Eucalyptus grandis]|uniref:Uncharacterized protein n=2 Tax=Eucalyptus grandis TaxID=71139 RepID=A0ACC3LF38_EUCGR|nr:hypothetical protein EUGRSUZ_E03539 [Eucalyptus grandis]